MARGRQHDEIMRALRQGSLGHGRSIPAVAMSAYARTEDRVQALAAGYQMHVAKPVEPAEILLVIAALVGRKAAR